ncbi:DUF1552 domain-containing protein [Agaribacterium haliotis]|uniref:DUF1552 domain-containing protein n=1 Tax=Agaribacterium haliotis TaxID=2013869 RepID=UPI000BB58F3D|nr:DUF1552 domain-containing protein [Agaribacterium haliotis]
MKLSRRTFLRSTSYGVGTAVGLPLLEAMFNSSSAYADAPGLYPRFFAMYVPNGIIEEKWYPENGSKTDFDLSGTALERFQTLGLTDAISLYRGCTNVCRLEGSSGNAHMVGISSWLTGKAIDSDRSQVHVSSLDQQIADALPRTKVHSLQLAGNSELDKPNNNVYFNPLKNALNWDKNGRLLPLKSELKNEFDKLYAGDGAAPGQGVDRRTALKISVLDDIKEDRQRLIAKLGAADAQRMEQYFESLRDLELKLEALNNSDDSSSCPRPTIDESSIPNPNNGSRNNNIKLHAEIAAKITAQAFACGLTNAITYCAGGEAAGCEYRDIGINTHFHNTISHNRNGRYDDWCKVDRLHGDLCAEFMLQLKQTPHGAGNLLDGTALMFGSGLGNGDAHQHTKIALMVGGHFGNWQHGRYHQLNGRNHADVVDTIRQQIGLAENYGRNQVPIS